jgi:hypothetical protein
MEGKMRQEYFIAEEKLIQAGLLPSTCTPQFYVLFFASQIVFNTQI